MINTVLKILTVVVLIPWFPMCMMSPMSLAAHGAYEKENIIIGLILSYPIIIFSVYWFFDASLFSVPATTLLKWSLVIAGIPVILILGNAINSLVKSRYIDIALFPAIEIKLTYNGKPASAAKLVQSITVREDTPVEHTFTANNQGETILPAYRKTVRISPMAQLTYRQRIHVNYDHKDFFIWFLDVYQATQETTMRPLSLTCELMDEMVNAEVNNGTFRTSCKGDGIVTSTKQGFFDEQIN